MVAGSDGRGTGLVRSVVDWQIVAERRAPLCRSVVVDRESKRPWCRRAVCLVCQLRVIAPRLFFFYSPRPLSSSDPSERDVLTMEIETRDADEDAGAGSARPW